MVVTALSGQGTHVLNTIELKTLKGKSDTSGGLRTPWSGPGGGPPCYYPIAHSSTNSRILFTDRPILAATRFASFSWPR